MGVAILDTKDLRSSQEKFISTYNFALGSPKYITKAQNKFIFGETETIKRQNLAPRLETLIPRSRSLILVAHGIASDLGCRAGPTQVVGHVGIGQGPAYSGDESHLMTRQARGESTRVGWHPQHAKGGRASLIDGDEKHHG